MIGALVDCSHIFPTRSCDELAHDQGRIDALEDASKAARSARKKISETLTYMTSAEDDIRSKFGALRDGMSKSRLLVRVVNYPSTV